MSPRLLHEPLHLIDRDHVAKLDWQRRDYTASDHRLKLGAGHAKSYSGLSDEKDSDAGAVRDWCRSRRRRRRRRFPLGWCSV